jgi:uncharacterized protein
VFALLLGAVALIAGAIAAVTGFGVGSLLTPALSLQVTTKVAVAAIAIPHFVATAQRFWVLRRYVDRRVLVEFGSASAVGGLAGALLHTRFSSSVLTVLFGVLLILAGVSQLTGWVERVRWSRSSAWVAGALSGGLGGMVGNQGGIRAAAMLGFNVPKESFVATATAIGLLVDGARLPVYLVTEWREITAIWPLVLVATIGVVVGTAAGTPLLRRIPEQTFKRVLGVLLVLLGAYMVLSGIQ